MNHLSIESRTAKLIIADAACGANIGACCEEAVAMAQKYLTPVQFIFNGVTVVVDTMDIAAERAAFYQKESQRRHEEYKKSPEYLALQDRRGAQLRSTQACIDTMLTTLPTVTWSEGTLMRWLGEFASINDYIGLNFSKQVIGHVISCDGWLVNDCLHHHDVKHSRSVYARWVVGQALDMLHIDMPIHQIISIWAEAYENWKPAYRSRNQREGHFIGRVRQFKDGKRVRIRRRQGIGSFKNWTPLREMPKAHKHFVELYLKQAQ